MKTTTTTQLKQVEYSPSNYEALKNYATKINLNAQLLKISNDKKLVNVIEFEMLKMLSLSPKSLALKMKECQQCLINKSTLTSSEVDLLNALFQAYENNNPESIINALMAIVNARGKSKAFQVIADEIIKSGILDNGPNTGPDVTARGWFSTLLTAVGMVIGSLIGLIAGGPLGPWIGAVAGAFIGKGLAQLTFPKEPNGFMLGPNGEPCTPPFLQF